MPPLYWVILAIALFIGEVFTFDFSLSCFGLGCLLAALISWLGLSIYWQVAGLSAAIAVLFFTLRPLILKSLNKKAAGYKSNADALIGAKAVVSDVSAEDKRRAQARFDGDVWPVICDKELEEGQIVVVESVEGITLKVKKEE